MVYRFSAITTLMFAVYCSGCHVAFSQVDDGEITSKPLTGLSFNGLSSEEMDLLREYADAVHQLRTFYSDIQMTAIERMYLVPRSADDDFPLLDMNRDIELRETLHFEFFARGGDFFLLRGHARNEEEPSTSPASHVAIIRPDESYLLGLDRGSKEYFLIGHGKDREKSLDRLESYIFPIATFGFGVFRLDNLLLHSHPESRIETVELTEDDDGNEIVVITRSLLAEDSSVIRAQQIFQFYRNRCWAVKSGEHINDKNETGPDKGLVLRVRQTCEYKGDRRGIPLLERVVYQQVSGRPPEVKVQVRSRRDFHITDINPETPPLEVFRVDNYINKFERVGEPRESSIAWLVMSINGILLLIAAICSILWMRRRRRTT